jgi:hypothetical protein
MSKSFHTVRIDRAAAPSSVKRDVRKYLWKNNDLVASGVWRKKAKRALALSIMGRAMGLHYMPLLGLALVYLRRARRILGPRHVSFELPTFSPVSQTIVTCRDAIFRFGLRFDQKFRFTSPEIFMRVAHQLGFTETVSLDDPGVRIELPSRHVVGGIAAFLCYTLRFGHTVTALDDAGEPFGWESTRTSRVLRYVSVHIHERFCRLVKAEFSLFRVSHATKVHWNQRVRAKFEMAMANEFRAYPDRIVNVAAFVDGKFISAQRSTDDRVNMQQFMYNGNHSDHGINFLAITSPCGLVLVMDGPWPGKENDLVMVRQGGFYNMLPDAFGRFDVLGDAIFGNDFNIKRVPNAAELERDEYRGKVGATIGSMRSAVEHTFAQMTRMWPYFTEKAKMNIERQSARDWLVCTVLLNCRMCVEGGQQASFYGVLPPALETYLDETRMI